MVKSRSNRSFPIIIMILGGILLVVALIWLGFGNFQSEATSGVTSERSEGGIPLPEIQRVALQEAYSAYDAGNAVFLDVRSAEAYQAEHISGARSLPEVDLQERYAELDKGRWIITYCT